MTGSDKRIAIASCHDKKNFGSALQAYATQHAIGDLGCKAITLDKSDMGAAIAQGRRSYYREHLFDAGLYRAKLGFVGHRIRRKINGDFGAKMRERSQAFDVFAANHFKLSPRFSTFEELGDYCSNFDAVVVGSDQLWLPVNIAGDYYTLSFVKEPTRRISYATSVGVASLPDAYLRKMRDFLAPFSAVSVREDTGADIVEHATGIRPHVVCDPTMLLSREQWLTIANADHAVPDEPYVLCYFLGKNVWNRECARDLARRAGCKIVAVAHPDEYVPYDETYADFYPYDAGPAEWLSLVAHAQFVCTDSFHGSVFSNIFERQFFAFRRHENMGAQSTNSRLDTLLGRLGLTSRLCESKEDFARALEEDIDFAASFQALVAYREESASWLRRAIAGGGAR